MPELHEVETVMRGLQQRIEGRVIVRATAHRPDLRWPLPEGLERRLTGARVTSFRRRAKYILMRLAGSDSVLLHLGMSGRMVLGPARPNQPSDFQKRSAPWTTSRNLSSVQSSAPASQPCTSRESPPRNPSCCNCSRCPAAAHPHDTR